VERLRLSRGWIRRLIEKEVALQLNVVFFGRKAGPRGGGLTRVRDKPVLAKASGLGVIHPLLPQKGKKAS